MNITSKLTIFNPKIWGKYPKCGMQIFRIELSEMSTRIDFISHPDTINCIANWWIAISQNTFIRPVDSNHTFPLQKAINICLSPQKYFFKHAQEILSFTLLFPPLPKGIELFDIIQSDNGEDESSNFYLVSLLHSNSKNPMYSFNKN